MPRKTKNGKPFNQAEYIREWGKQNMAAIGSRYKKEFVQEFKTACAALNLKQSDVFRQAMKKVIDEYHQMPEQ